jgi:subtilase family serine protease
MSFDARLRLEKFIHSLKGGHRSRPLLGAALALIVEICPASAAGLKMLPGHVPPVVASLKAEGLLPATKQLRLAIGLPLRDAHGLDDFLAQLYDPASPNFRRYLTSDEITARFGPTEQNYETVKNFARTNGLTITATYNNRLVLVVTGTAAAVQKAFHVTLRTYRHPREARDFFAPDTEPEVAAMLPVVDVQGLSDYSRPRPRLHRMNAVATAAMTKNGSAPNSSGSYFGNDFRNAYAPDSTLTGAGQIVGMFEADGFYSNDIAAYAAAAGNGRTNIPIQTVLLDGFNGTPTTGANSGNVEVSLDIEMAMAMAPGLAKIVVYEGNPNSYLPNDILNAMLSDSNTVKVFSCSWGWSGGPSTTTDNIFKKMSAAGQSFFNASGDSDAFTSGASSVNGVDNPSTENAPSSSPYITQVGGTTLTTGAGAAYGAETVWNWGGGSGSSGGISSHYPIPNWQTNVNNLTTKGGSASSRNIPDVALTSDNIYVAFGNGSQAGFGGTSCAAPLWAGFVALANQQAAAAGRPAVGFVNPALYTIASGTGYANCFHDVTTGNNTWSKSPNLFYAATGYDLGTGLGTPAGQILINTLVGGDDPLTISPLAGAATGLAGGPFTIAPASFLLINTGISSLTWSVAGIPFWLNLSPTNGNLGAAAATNVTFTLTPAAGTLAGGTYTASLSFSNWNFQSTQAGLFRLQVNQPLSVSPTNGFNASGPAGGPFNVTSQNYSLTNLSGSSLIWGVLNAPSWLNVSPSGDALAGGTSTTMTVSLSAAAASLGTGVYAANLPVTNAAGLAASLSFTINVSQSTVDNGGFESGNFSGWSLNASSKYDFVTTSSGLVHSGSNGAALGQTGSLGYLYQTLATSPGQNYLLSLWLDNPNNPAGASPNQFQVQWNGTTLFNQTNLPFMAWTNLQFVVTATGTSTVLKFGFQDNPYYLGLDDISVLPVSAPVFNAAPATSPATTFNFTWTTVAGLSYQVQYKTNLQQASWINLGGPVIATTDTLSMSDTNAISLSPSRFYRVVIGQ